MVDKNVASFLFRKRGVYYSANKFLAISRLTIQDNV